jgi:hypothetical protein
MQKKPNHTQPPQTFSQPLFYAKTCEKPLKEQISVVAEFHAYKIEAGRIAYRTGIDLHLVKQLINGESHQHLFKALLAHHHKKRREQRLQQSLRKKGIAQATLQDQIEQEYLASCYEINSGHK